MPCCPPWWVPVLVISSYVFFFKTRSPLWYVEQMSGDLLVNKLRPRHGFNAMGFSFWARSHRSEPTPLPPGQQAVQVAPLPPTG